MRLHSTFRHDLKIKTSDEGRVMKTAAAFAKGLLELEGDLPPILVSLVHKEKGSMHMLVGPHIMMLTFMRRFDESCIMLHTVTNCSLLINSFPLHD